MDLSPQALHLGLAEIPAPDEGTGSMPVRRGGSSGSVEPPQILT